MADPKLDPIDRKLFRELQRDASISHAELAALVGASTASCWRRIGALERYAALGSRVWLVDAIRVGRGVNVICQIKIKNHPLETTEKFESFIAS